MVILCFYVFRDLDRVDAQIWIFYSTNIKLWLLFLKSKCSLVYIRTFQVKLTLIA